MKGKTVFAGLAGLAVAGTAVLVARAVSTVTAVGRQVDEQVEKDPGSETRNPGIQTDADRGSHAAGLTGAMAAAALRPAGLRQTRAWMADKLGCIRSVWPTPRRAMSAGLFRWLKHSSPLL